ncbi:hypothetical protein Tco_0908427 [Tanacetum coccineum]|uniref:Uncharacterized protein n=1 Tax=Tanacetum coccineum TaxID=301880 RepID=A0ABQ5CP18_9ASTR
MSRSTTRRHTPLHHHHTLPSPPHTATTTSSSPSPPPTRHHSRHLLLVTTTPRATITHTEHHHPPQPHHHLHHGSRLYIILQHPHLRTPITTTTSSSTPPWVRWFYLQAATDKVGSVNRKHPKGVFGLAENTQKGRLGEQKTIKGAFGIAGNPNRGVWDSMGVWLGRFATKGAWWADLQSKGAFWFSRKDQIRKFEEPPLEEDILSFIRDLGHTGEIKFLSDVNVNHMHQPWRSFAAIINKCLSGKTTALESLRLSRAQILWGMYHNKKVDYVYLLWEDLMFQVENKNSKKNNDMYYPRFTKVIVDYFMAKDQAIPRRNKMFWHHARDDFMFTTVRVISKHQDTQVYGAILPQHLTNQAMLESEAYMTYRAYATGEKTPKPKTTKKKADSEASPKTKTTQATKGKRIKSSAKGDKAAKKKQPAETSMDKGLMVLSNVALTEAEQLKLVIERSKTQTHSSHASGSGADEGTGDIPGVPDVPTYGSDDEQISWKSSEEDDEDEVNVSEKDDDNDDADNQDDENPDKENHDDDEKTDSDTDGDDFVHPKFLTHDDEARQEEVNKEDNFDPRVQTPSHVKSTNDESNEESDEEVQGTNTKEEQMGKDTVTMDAPLPNVQATQETEDTHVIHTAPINPEGQQQSSSVSSGFVSNMLNPRPDTSIDSIFNTGATSLVDVPVTTIGKPPLVFATTLPPPPTPLITHMQQT